MKIAKNGERPVKTPCTLMMFAISFLVMAAGVYAQSPREQLQQLTIELQKTPSDTALRERIIKLGAEIKPAPAIPEEARRSFVEGVTIVKAAKDASAQKLATGSFNEALKIAPWWGDAYYNLAVAQELAGELTDAERTLKWFLLFNPGESDAREAQDRIYALSAKRKLAIAEAGAKQEQADREIAAQAQRFEGDWVRDVRGEDGSESRYTLTIRRDADGSWRVHIFSKSGSHVSESRVHDIRVVGTELRFEHDHMYGSEISATYEVSTSLSMNGNTLRLAYTPMPLTARQEALAKNWRRWPLSPYMDEYMKQ